MPHKKKVRRRKIKGLACVQDALSDIVQDFIETPIAERSLVNLLNEVADLRLSVAEALTKTK